MIILEEEWRDIIIEKGGVTYNFTGKYQVSNLGRVKNTKTGQVLKPPRGKLGYISVGLSIDGCKHWFYVHRLVAIMFIPNPDNLPEVNHLNEDKTDNRVENLKWCTRQQNAAYSQNKKVRCIETKQVFDSIEEASDWYQRETGGSRIAGSICACCKGERKTAYGYTWEYVDSVD